MSESLAGRFYGLVGKDEASTELDADTFAKLADPIGLEESGRLAYGSTTDWTRFKQCAGLGSGRRLGEQRSSTLLEGSQAHTVGSDHSTQHEVRLLQSAANIDAELLSSLALDAQYGSGVKGAEGRLQTQDTLSTEDHAILSNVRTDFTTLRVDPVVAEGFLVVDVTDVLPSNSTCTLSPSQRSARCACRFVFEAASGATSGADGVQPTRAQLHCI